MGALDDDFAFLAATAHRLIDELAAEVTPRVHGKGRGAVLAEHINQTLDAIRARVTRDETRFAAAQSATAKATLARQLRLLVALTWGIHEAMPWIDPPRHQLDLGTAFLIDETALAMIGPPVEVLPVESNHYMYWTLSWPFEELWSENLKQPMPRGTRPIVLAYPAREAPSALLHGAFAHELAHAAVDHHDLLGTVADPLLQGSDYSAAITARFGTATDAATVRSKQNVGNQVEEWIEELLCDQLALTYLGPSFLFCFAGMVLPVTWNEPQDQHPNATMRMRFMLDTVRANHWDTLVSERLPTIWAWFEQAAATKPAVTDPITELLIDTCEAVEPEIRRVTSQTIGTSAFDAAAYANVGERLAELLNNDILPAQLNPTTAADHRHILLAAWLHAVDHNGGRPAAIPAALAQREYQRFIAKALEMSTTFTAWKRACP